MLGSGNRARLPIPSPKVGLAQEDSCFRPGLQAAWEQPSLPGLQTALSLGGGCIYLKTLERRGGQMEGSPRRLLGGARDGGSPLQLAGGAAGHSPLSLAPGVSWCQLFYFRLLAPPLGDSQPAWEPITAGTGTLTPGLPSSPCGHPGPGEGRTPRFPPHDPVRAPGSYPTETLIVTKPWRQPNKCAARALSCQGNGLESAR